MADTSSSSLGRFVLDCLHWFIGAPFLYWLQSSARAYHPLDSHPFTILRCMDAGEKHSHSEFPCIYLHQLFWYLSAPHVFCAGACVSRRKDTICRHNVWSYHLLGLVRTHKHYMCLFLLEMDLVVTLKMN